MKSIDKAAIIWSVAIVAVAVGFTTMSNDTNTLSDGIYREKASGNMLDDITSEPHSIKATPISLDTDRDTYLKNDMIKVSGSVNPKSSDMPITLMVLTPNGDLITIAQISVDEDSSFSYTILVDGPLWILEGEYTIRVHYGSDKNTAETTFDFVAPLLQSNTKNVFAINHEDGIYQINYDITNAKVQDITVDHHCKCLIVQVESHDDGVLIIDLPRDIIDAKIHGSYDDMFFVLMDGIEIPYEEVAADTQSRKIQIRFENGTSELEIIGTEVNMPFANSDQ